MYLFFYHILINDPEGTRFRVPSKLVHILMQLNGPEGICFIFPSTLVYLSIRYIEMICRLRQQDNLNPTFFCLIFYIPMQLPPISHFSARFLLSCVVLFVFIYSFLVGVMAFWETLIYLYNVAASIIRRIVTHRIIYLLYL